MITEAQLNKLIWMAKRAAEDGQGSGITIAVAVNPVELLALCVELRKHRKTFKEKTRGRDQGAVIDLPGGTHE
jgi:hypothetical protein